MNASPRSLPDPSDKLLFLYSFSGCTGPGIDRTASQYFPWSFLETEKTLAFVFIARTRKAGAVVPLAGGEERREMAGVVGMLERKSK